MAARKSVANLTSTERNNFVNAVLALKQGTDRYQPFTDTHVQFFGSVSGTRWAHRSPSFLPWHRKYLLEFETLLQSVDATVTIPYWDWSAQRSTTGPPWTSDLLGGDGTGSGGAVTTGPFRRGAWAVQADQSGRTYIARRFGGDNGGVTLPTLSQVTSVLGLTPYDQSPWGDTAGGFRNNLEGFTGPNLHNRIHNWIGGTMPTQSSPNDPVFWMHHCFVDKLWADWQARNPQAAKYLPNSGTSGVVDLNERMQPWGDATSSPASLLDHTTFYTYE